MFQLTTDEYARLRSQIVTFKKGRDQHRKHICAHARNET